MHPDLSPHLHTEECNLLIHDLKECHNENPFIKFLGVCNKLDEKVVQCLRNERKQRQKANFELSRQRLARLNKNTE